MTLTGTNTYVLTSQDDTSAVVIDPGPEMAEHRQAFLAEVADRDLTAIVLTHQHADHSEMLGSIEQWAPEVPVYAVLERFARHTDPVADGDEIAFGSTPADVLRVVATPDTRATASPHHAGAPSGDTIRGGHDRHPSARLAARSPNSLDRLRELLDAGEFAIIEPAHGERIDAPAEVIDYYRSHRLERIEQVKAALEQGASTASEVCDIVYHDVDPSVRPAAEQIVKAQLAYLDALPADDA